MPTKSIPIPPQPPGSYRIALELTRGGFRIDAILLEELRRLGAGTPAMPQPLREISRSALKKLFRDHRVMIKGQSATPSSTLAAGITYIDILGFEAKSSDPGNAALGDSEPEESPGN